MRFKNSHLSVLRLYRGAIRTIVAGDVVTTTALVAATTTAAVVSDDSLLETSPTIPTELDEVIEEEPSGLLLFQQPLQRRDFTPKSPSPTALPLLKRQQVRFFLQYFLYIPILFFEGRIQEMLSRRQCAGVQLKRRSELGYSETRRYFVSDCLIVHVLLRILVCIPVTHFCSAVLHLSFFFYFFSLQSSP